MKPNDFINKLGEGCSPEHDKLVFEAEAYFRKNFKVGSVSYEVPVGDRFIIGYVDLYIVTLDGKRFIVEVKPVIESFGALLRQLNTYKLHKDLIDFKHRHDVFTFCVYTHDQRYATQIESQGYVCYPKPTKKKFKTK